MSSVFGFMDVIPSGFFSLWIGLNLKELVLNELVSEMSRLFEILLLNIVIILI